jgi:hypothetical protein
MRITITNDDGVVLAEVDPDDAVSNYLEERGFDLLNKSHRAALGMAFGDDLRALAIQAVDDTNMEWR